MIMSAHPKPLVILMLGGARRVAIARMFKQIPVPGGRKVKILSYELTRYVPISCEGAVIEGLRWNDPEVVDDIVRISIEEEVDIILPFVDGAIEIAAHCRARLPNVFIPVSEPEVCRCLFDKVEAAKAFEKAGLPIPSTYNAVSATIPAIAKPRFGSASRGIKIYESGIEDLMQLPDMGNYLIQEYIPHRNEYTVDCYVSLAGEIMTVVPRIRLEVMGGEVTRTQTKRIDVLDTLSRKVIDTFRLRGPVTIQYLHDLETDRFMVMEVNPRLGGGVVCSIQAGAPIAEYIVREALGMPLSPCRDWHPETLITRYWGDVCFHLNQD